MSKLYSLQLALAFSGLGFILTVFRDVLLNNHIDDAIFFVTYISICALITTPVSERMQYGISYNEKFLNYSYLIFFSSLAFNIFFYFFDLNNIYIKCIGLIINIIICICIAWLIGILAGRNSPHKIRLISPLFPALNLVLVFIFHEEKALNIVNFSYQLLFGIVIIFFLLQAKDGMKKSLYANEEKTSHSIIFNSLIWHYLVFGLSYIYVLINANIINFNSIFINRLPIYFYIIFSIFLPYINIEKYIRSIFIAICLILFISLILLISESNDSSKKILIFMIQLLSIILLSIIAKIKSKT